LCYYTHIGSRCPTGVAQLKPLFLCCVVVRWDQGSKSWQDDVENQELIWLEQARRGDRAAFSRLVEVYQGPVYNLAYRMLGNGVEAEDATQETFIRMYTKLNTYRPDHKLSSWILSIASHYCIDRLRRRHGQWLSLDDEPVATTLPSRQRGPEETVLRNESRFEVQKMVDALPPAYRVPLILRYWYDLSYTEIAEVMDLTVQAVKSRLHRARLQMIDKAPSGSAAATMLAGTIGVR
jgi:RNA polymerase sigma-70 factor (ECF subfamily)